MEVYFTDADWARILSALRWRTRHEGNLTQDFVRSLEDIIRRIEDAQNGRSLC